MSLIEEALRRVQNPSSASGKSGTAAKPSSAKQEPAALPHSWPVETPEAPSSATHPAATRPAPLPSSSSSSQQPWILLVVLAAVAGCAVALLIGGVLWVKTAPSAKPAIQNTAANTNPQPAKNDKSPTRSSANPLNLTGVVTGEGSIPYAVINGKIFGIGEQVEAAKIIAIDTRSVTLEYPNGQQTTLSVPR